MHTKSMKERKIDDINLFHPFRFPYFLLFFPTLFLDSIQKRIVWSRRGTSWCVHSPLQWLYFSVEASIRFDYLFYPRLCCISSFFSRFSFFYLLSSWMFLFETNGCLGCDEPISLHHSNAGQCTLTFYQEQKKKHTSELVINGNGPEIVPFSGSLYMMDILVGWYPQILSSVQITATDLYFIRDFLYFSSSTH